MAPFLSVLFCIYFASVTIAVPYTAPLVQRTSTDLDLDAAENVTQEINATITDRAGNDITAAFDIMIFHDSSASFNSTVPGNKTDAAKNSSTSLLDRRQPTFSRSITYCPLPNSVFISSWCTPADNKKGSLQSYTVNCHRTENLYHPYTSKFLYTSTFPARRDGHCYWDEVCINSETPSDGALNGYGIKFANCVQRRAFRKLGLQSTLGLKLDKEALKDELEGKRLRMMVSKPDMSTPLEVDTFHVEAELEGGGDKDNGGPVQKCRDCMELETQQFKKGVESLKAEARMLNTGVMAGVLWLAVMSG